MSRSANHASQNAPRSKEKAAGLTGNVERRDAHRALVLERGSTGVHDANLVHVCPRLAVPVVGRKDAPRPGLHEDLPQGWTSVPAQTGG